jgi:hypothetical protein
VKFFAAFLIVLLMGGSAMAGFEMDKALHFGGSAFGTSAMMEMGMSPEMAALTMLMLGALKERTDAYWDGKDFAADALGTGLALLLRKYGRVQTTW